MLFFMFHFSLKFTCSGWRIDISILEGPGTFSDCRHIDSSVKIIMKSGVVTLVYWFPRKREFLIVYFPLLPALTLLAFPPFAILISKHSSQLAVASNVS